jgi:hypothetical protein
MATWTRPGQTEAIAVILGDRSGSMGELGMWAEALGGINAYVEELAKTVPWCEVTVAFFDSVHRFDVVRDCVPAGDWRPVTGLDATPRGSTPLYDAIIRLCSWAQSKGVARTSLVIMTDGRENASHEAHGRQGREMAKAALDQCRARGWDVVFLGANWDAMEQATEIGTQSTHTMNFASGSGVQTMTDMGTRSASYSTGQTTADAAIPEAVRKRGNFNP